MSNLLCSKNCLKSTTAMKVEYDGAACPVMLQPVPPKSVPPDQLEQLYLVPPDHLEHYSLSPPDKLRCHRRSPSAISGPPTSCIIDSIIDL